MGTKYLIYQRSYRVLARDLSGLEKIDCQKLENDIAQKKGQYSVCLDNPDTPYCQLLKQDILFMSKEENFQVPPLSHSTPRKWSLKKEGPKDTQSSIIQFASENFKIPKKDILFKEAQRKNDATPLFIELKDDSLLKIVTQILPLGTDFEKPYLSRANIVANNRFFACDFEKRRLNIASSFTASIFHEEIYAQEIIDALWTIYENTASLMQEEEYKSSSNYLKAALLGEKISLGLLDSTIKNDTNINLKTIFAQWFVERASSLELKLLTSKAHFKDTLYSDQFFENEVEISWNVR